MMKKLLYALVLLSCGAPDAPKESLAFVRPHLTLLSDNFDEAQAVSVVDSLTRVWRIAGTSGYETASSLIVRHLSEAGFGRQEGLALTVEKYPLDIPLAWEPRSAQFSVVDAKGRTHRVASFDSVAVMLCPNSYPTNVTAPIVDIGMGAQAEDYFKKDIRGKIVLGEAPVSALYHHAVKTRGAAGVVSSYILDVHQAHPDLVHTEDIPYSTETKGFGLKISQSQLSTIREWLNAGSARAAVSIDTRFVSGEQSVIHASIAGTERKNEHVIAVAHLDHYKPGANDNASGSATLLQMASAMSRDTAHGPRRTMDFLWVDEYVNEFRSGGTGAWIRNHLEDFKQTVAMFAVDMVGADARKSGGSFRIEKYPDPSITFPRPHDAPSGWKQEQDARIVPVPGAFINDYVLTICRMRQMETPWKLTSNPYEGGSDHVPFVEAQIPAVLAWHYPDPFYHSSLDDVDKIDPTEMKNAGVVVGAAMLGLAHADERESVEMLDLLTSSARRRFELELSESQRVLGSGGDLVREKEILEAWQMWYVEAIRSVARLVAAGRMDSQVKDAEETIRQIASESIHRLQARN